MNIYIDIGNTNIKLLYEMSNKEFLLKFKTSDDISRDSFYKKLPTEITANNIHSLWMSSVVPDKEKTILETFKHYFDIKINVINNSINSTNISIDLDDPTKLGSDLFCLSAFIADKTKNGIIVNMGTATTITHVIENTIKGVIIIPGFTISFNSLIKSAAKLLEPKLLLNKNTLGKNTGESISIGMIKGHEHMIKGLVNDIDKKAKLFLSGGNSIFIKDYLNEFEYIPEATIKGLKIISNCLSLK